MTGIVRAPRSHTHDLMPRAALRDSRLSYRARGILMRLLSNADGYSMTAEDLARTGREGRAAVLTAMHELRAVGYVRTTRTQTAKGTWRTETVAYEVPASPASATGVRKPDSGFPDAGSPDPKSRKNKKEGSSSRGPAETSAHGIACWTPSDPAAAEKIEATAEPRAIIAAVAEVAAGGRSPVPGLVARVLRREARAKTARERAAEAHLVGARRRARAERSGRPEARTAGKAALAAIAAELHMTGGAA